MTRLIWLTDRLPAMVNHPFLLLVGWKVILLSSIVHLQVDDAVFEPQLALYQVLAFVIVTWLAVLLRTFIKHFGLLSPTPALLSNMALASLLLVSVKSNPSIYFPILFHEFPVMEILVKFLKVVG